MTTRNEAILQGIARLRSRAARIGFARYGLRALFYALLLAAILLVLLPGVPTLALLGGLLALAAVAALALGFARRPAAAEAAKLYDDHIGLKDTMSSSVELIGSEGPMVRVLLEDAASRASDVRPEEVFRFRMPREGWLLPVPVTALVLVLVLPGLLGANPSTDPELASELAAGTQELQDFIASERDKQPTPRREELLAELEDVTAELSRRPIDKKEALAEISKLMENLASDQQELEQEELELKKLVKSLQANDRTQELAEEINNGAYSDAANRVAELMDELKKKIEAKRKAKAPEEELEELEEQLRELEDLKAKLMKLMNVQYDLNARAKVLEFLEFLEGEIGDVPDEEVIDAKFVRFGQCEGQCEGDKIVKLPQMLLPPTDKAGKGTMDYFGEETRNDATTEEHKVTVRETSGTSAFTQTQVADDGSRSQMAEREVLQAEKRAAEETIHRQDVPAGYRDYIRQYFDQIQPDPQEGEREEGR